MNNSTKRSSVLIVEDSPAYQEIYEEILSADYDLEIAGDKEEALARLRERVFDVALVDMRLKENEKGNTDGLDIAQFVRDMGLPTAVILKSGFPTESPEIAARLERLNLFAVLDKSAESQVKELKELIARAVAKA